MSAFNPIQLFEEATGECEVCHDIEVPILKAECGHWACDICLYTAVQGDENGAQVFTGCDNCLPPWEKPNEGNGQHTLPVV